MQLTNWRQALSAVLCIVMMISLCPVLALASDEPAAVETDEPVAEEIMTEEGGEKVLTAEEMSLAEAEPEMESAEVALAEEEAPVLDSAGVEAVSVSYAMTYYNPLYEEVSDLEAVALDGDDGASATEYYTTVVEAAAAVREQMKARETSFVIGYATTETATSDFLSSTMEEIVEQAMIHTGVPTEGDYLRWQYKNYTANADGDYVDGVYYLNFHYSFSYFTTASQESALDKAVVSLLDSLDIHSGNDYAKIRAVYDHICANVRYDYSYYSSLKYSAYAALVNGKAACQGYATLLYRLALELGIDCRIIEGTANGVKHEWNIVLVEGNYYNLDSTWDAGESEYNCFLVSNTNLKGHSRYSEFTSTKFNSSYPMSTEDYTLDAASSTDINWDGIQWVNENDVLTVSGVGAIPDCDSADQTPWAEETYTQIVIGDGLTGVGTNTFAGSAVTQVTVSEGVSAIGQDAFAGCDGLEHIYIMNDDCVIDDSVYTLGNPDTTIIHCYYNSTAMAYAEKHGYSYINMGFANCAVDLEVTTVNSADTPVARIYDASATDLEIYADIVLDEPAAAEDCAVTVSEETLREDGLYGRTISLQNVEPGRYYLAVYVPGSYVIRVEYISFSDDLDVGERHMWLYGDVDNNGLLDARDATQIYRQASDLASLFGSSGISDTESMRLKAADVNRDGFYNEDDALQVLYYIHQKPSSMDDIP